MIGSISRADGNAAGGADEVIDTNDPIIRNLMTSRRSHPATAIPWTPDAENTALPSLYGLRGGVADERQLEFFRNGHAELRIAEAA